MVAFTAHRTRHGSSLNAFSLLEHATRRLTRDVNLSHTGLCYCSLLCCDCTFEIGLQAVWSPVSRWCMEQPWSFHYKQSSLSVSGIGIGRYYWYRLILLVLVWYRYHQYWHRYHHQYARTWHMYTLHRRIKRCSADLLSIILHRDARLCTAGCSHAGPQQFAYHCSVLSIKLHT